MAHGSIGDAPRLRGQPRPYSSRATPGLGAGLRLIALTADRFAIRERTPRGTEVWMRFAVPAAPPGVSR